MAKATYSGPRNLSGLYSGAEPGDRSASRAGAQMGGAAAFTRTFTVIGDRELEAKLQALSRRAVGEGARRAVRAGSTPMLQAMKPRIPRGPTGNLQRSLTRKIKRNTKFPGNPYTANIFVAAPHAHLVRFGTKGPRRPKRGKLMSNFRAPYAAKGFVQRGRGGIAGGRAGYYMLSGKNASGTWGQTSKGTFFGRQVARMPANPGFSQVYDQHRQKFIDEVTRVMREVVGA